MSSLTSSPSHQKKTQEKTTRTVLIMAAVAVAGWLLWRNRSKSHSSDSKHSGGRSAAGNGKVVELMSPAEIASYSGVLLFYMNGCGPCNAVKPAFEQAASMSTGAAQFAKVERAVSQSLLDRYNVSGFPTIVKMSNGSVLDVFGGNRSAESISRFASSS